MAAHAQTGERKREWERESEKRYVCTAREICGTPLYQLRACMCVCERVCCCLCGVFLCTCIFVCEWSDLQHHINITQTQSRKFTGKSVAMVQLMPSAPHRCQPSLLSAMVRAGHTNTHKHTQTHTHTHTHTHTYTDTRRHKHTHTYTHTTHTQHTHNTHTSHTQYTH